MVSTDTILGDSDLFIDRTARTQPEILQLMHTLREHSKQVRDVTVSTKQLSFEVDPDFQPDAQRPIRLHDKNIRLVLTAPSQFNPAITMAYPYPLRATAHQQMAQELDIPWKYYQRCLAEDPNLLLPQLQFWLARVDKKYFIRTLGGWARAILSPNYLPLNSEELFLLAFKAAEETESEIIRAQLSETRFTLAIVKHGWAEQVYQDGSFTRVKDGEVAPMLSFANSDVRRGGLSAKDGLYTYTCTNHCVWMEVYNRRHIGSAADDGWEHDTEVRRLSAQLVWSKMTAAVRLAFKRDTYEAKLAKLRGAANAMVEKADEAVQFLGAEYAFTDDELTRVLNEFASPRRNTQDGSILGLVNAITSTAQDLPLERSQILEEAAGAILMKPLPEAVLVRPRNGRA